MGRASRKTAPRADLFRPSAPPPSNALYYGDNLDVLRESVADESVDLIYLDPPFNSKRDYNLLFKTTTGERSDAQITAFEDTWHWGHQAEQEFDELLKQRNTAVGELMRSLRGFLGESDVMAYLTMMANRLIELHRVLKPTGVLYLHCDPTASHYLKIVLDAVFGPASMCSEVIWKRTGSHSSAKRWGPVHDVIFMYAKQRGEHCWHRLFVPLTEQHLKRHYRLTDKDGRKYELGELTGPGTRNGNSGLPWRGFDVASLGRHWTTTVERLEEMYGAGRIVIPEDGGWPRVVRYEDDSQGTAIGDVWTDIAPLNMRARERLGYPTQKPVALLERIITASSSPGDVVLDPFCGCGTAVHAAQMLGRRWIGIDITHLAISLIEKRLKDAFGPACRFEVHGTPKDIAAARDLAQRDKYQFQWWAVSLVNALPYRGKQKGADGGVDGLKYFYDLEDEDPRKLIISVKGGHLKADDVRALNSVRERQRAEIGCLISLHEPTAKMKADAAAASFYFGGPGHKLRYAREQLLTVEGLLSGTQRAEHPDYKPDANHKRAQREVDRIGSLFG